MQVEKVGNVMEVLIALSKSLDLQFEIVEMVTFKMVRWAWRHLEEDAVGVIVPETFHILKKAMKCRRRQDSKFRIDSI